MNWLSVNPPRPDTPCVCGDPFSDHVTQLMSVEMMHNPDPLYKIPAGSFSNIATPRLSASYEHNLCHCGCSLFEEDVWTTNQRDNSSVPPSDT